VNIAGGGQSITVATPLHSRSSATTAGGHLRAAGDEKRLDLDWSSARRRARVDVGPVGQTGSPTEAA